MNRIEERLLADKYCMKCKHINKVEKNERLSYECDSYVFSTANKKGIINDCWVWIYREEGDTHNPAIQYCKGNYYELHQD